MPAAKAANFTWDVFFKGKGADDGSGGFAEHIQVGAESAEGLQDGRAAMITWLGVIEAEVLPRDKENARSFGPKAAAPRPKAQPGVTPVCPVDGGTMTLKTGTSGPMSKNPGQPYAFWGCDNFKTTNCRGTVQA